MSKKTTLLTVVVAATLLLAVAAIALNAPNRKASDQSASETTKTDEQPTPNKTESSPNDNQQVAATITYSDSGFQPATVTVKSGDTIRIENKSSQTLSFNSGDHPTHTKDSELNVGNVSQGSSKTFTVTKKGTWSYHNHNNASDTGTIIVE